MLSPWLWRVRPEGEFMEKNMYLVIVEVLHDGFKNTNYPPCPLLRIMVDAGYLGRKTGREFYDYSA